MAVAAAAAIIPSEEMPSASAVHSSWTESKAGQEDELRRDLSALVEPSRAEDGNLRYNLFEDQDEPGLFVFVEGWASVEARNKHHEHRPHIQHFHATGVSNVEQRKFAHILKRVV